MAQIIPPIVLSGTLKATSEKDYWMEDDGTGNIGQTAYTFSMILSITTQNHLCAFTPTPYSYDATDIKVGMWIGAQYGRALKIIEIDNTQTTSNKLYCVGQDIDRYNLINDPDQSGNGALPTGQLVYIFDLSQDGLPVLSPVVTDQSFVSDLMGRFIGRNLEDQNVEIYQPNHTMQVGDVIRPDFNNPGQFIQALGDQYADQIVGIVTEIGIPGVENFTFRPIGKYLTDVSPGLDGNPGDIFYVSPTTAGGFTKTRPNVYAKPIYLRMNSANSAILLNSASAVPTTYKMSVTPTDGQTVFSMPSGVEVVDIITMAVNGVECTDWTFDQGAQTLTYQASDYAIDSGDQVLIVYKA